MQKKINFFLNNSETTQKKTEGIFIRDIFIFLTGILLSTAIIYTFFRILPEPSYQEIQEIKDLFIHRAKGGVKPEPNEKIIYILNIIILVPCLYLLNKFIDIEKIVKTRILYHSAIFLILLFLSLLIWSSFKNNATNFYFYTEIQAPYKEIRSLFNKLVIDKNQLFYFPFSIAIIVLLSKIKLNTFKYTILNYGVLLWIIFVTCLPNINSSFLDYNGWDNHFSAFYFSIHETLNGRLLLHDLNNQYGLYPIFYKYLITMFNNKIFAVSLFSSAFSAIAFSMLWYASKYWIKSNIIRVSLISSTIFFTYLVLRINIFWDSYFQYYPLRILFPFIFIYLISVKDQIKNKWYYLITPFFCGLSCLFVLDSGLPLTIAFLISEILANKNKNNGFRFYSNLKFFLKFVIIFLLPLALYSLFVYVNSGVFIKFSNYFDATLGFFHYGYGMMKMPMFGAWNILICIYIASLYVVVKKFNNVKLKLDQIIIFLTIFGLGIFTYYLGRSHDFNLFGVSYPGIILLFIFFDRVINYKVWPKLPKYFVFSIFTLITIFVFSSLLNIDKNKMIYHRIIQNITHISNPLISDEILSRVDFIKNNTYTNEEILILDDNPVLITSLHYYSDTKSIMGIGPSEILLKNQLNNIQKNIKKKKNVKIFITDGNEEHFILKENKNEEDNLCLQKYESHISLYVICN